MAKRWSVEGTKRWRGGRVGGLYDGIDFYVCEKYKMMDINLPRLAAILLLLLLLFCHSSSSLGSVTLSLLHNRVFAYLTFSLPPTLSPSYHPPPLTNRTYTVYPVHSDVDLRESTPRSVCAPCVQGVPFPRPIVPEIVKIV